MSMYDWAEPKMHETKSGNSDAARALQINTQGSGIWFGFLLGLDLTWFSFCLGTHVEIRKRSEGLSRRVGAKRRRMCR